MCNIKNNNNNKEENFEAHVEKGRVKTNPLFCMEKNMIMIMTTSAMPKIMMKMSINEKGEV